MTYQDTSTFSSNVPLVVFLICVALAVAVAWFMRVKYPDKLTSLPLYATMGIGVLGVFVVIAPSFKAPEFNESAVIANIEQKYDVKDVSLDQDKTYRVTATASNGEQQTYRYAENRISHEPILTSTTEEPERRADR